ncbi:MAG: hypothetical protein M5U07_18135 [Xanthobacteraceae bacterium]|nr:hypothetical protein [Xanthobacteraceae bacterium]
MAVDARDHRNRAGAHGAEQPHHRIVDLGGIDAEGVAVGVGLEVAAGAEHLAGAGDHHGADGAVLVGGVHAREQPVEDRLVEGIAPPLAVDGQPEGRSAALAAHLLHGVLPY